MQEHCNPGSLAIYWAIQDSLKFKFDAYGGAKANRESHERYIRVRTVISDNWGGLESEPEVT